MNRQQQILRYDTLKKFFKEKCHILLRYITA